VIAAPAAVAVWSGWVGLGGLCGFGPVHPLPGIANGFTLNTAITLPIGVEAYGAYALGAWLTPGTPERAQAFARRSAVGSLGLGMLGQIAYHLLAAAHAAHAPWPVTTLVSCLPVVALAFGAALAHLLREPAHEDVPEADELTEDEPVKVPTTVPATAAETVADSVLEEAPIPAPASTGQAVAPRTDLPVPASRARTVSSKRAPRKRNGATPRRAEAAFADVLAEGRVPSLRAIKAKLHVGTDRARELHVYLDSVVTARTEAAA
jgi:hypothetical protein